MTLKVNVQGVFAPLLGAINASKTGGDSSVEITYSLGESLKASAKGESAFTSGLSYADFSADVQNVFTVWETLLNSLYRKNTKNKNALQVTFKMVEGDSDITLKATKLPKGLAIRVSGSTVDIDPSKEWVSLRAVRGLNTFNYLVYGVGRLLGFKASSGVSILNPNLLGESFIVRYGLNVDRNGIILNPLEVSTSGTLGAITSSFGSNDTNLPRVYGCINPNAPNYNSAATYDDGTCEEAIPVVGGSRVITQTDTDPFLYVASPNGVGDILPGGNIINTLFSEELPITITPDFSAVFVNEGVRTFYALIETSGKIQVFNSLLNLTSTSPSVVHVAPSYLDPELSDGNPAMIRVGNNLVFTAAGVRVHKLDPEANQIDATGATVVNCESEAPLGNYIEDIALFPANLKSKDLTVGFESYAYFLADADSTQTAEVVGDAQDITTYTSSVASKKLASYKSWTADGYVDMIVMFDLYSSALVARYGVEAISVIKRMHNGIAVGDGTYHYRHTIGKTSSDSLDGYTIISTFEGFSFDEYDKGIYSLSGNKWDDALSTLTSSGTPATVNLTAPSDHEKLISQLPVVIGNRLFEDIGDVKASQIGIGGSDITSYYDDQVAKGNVNGNEVGYYKVAYATKHGFILMAIYSQSPFLLRPNDGGIEAHVCGGDPADAGVISAGGYTPISMSFSKDNNYLYAILRDPDTMDKYIGIYDITSNDGAIISASVQMVADPLDSGISRVLTVGSSVYFLSKGSNEYVRVLNADTFTGVQAFILNANSFVRTSTTSLYLPTHTEETPSLTDDTFVEVGSYSVSNNYELSSYIASPRGVLNANSPTDLEGLVAGNDEWLGSATANDAGGNLLLTAAITDEATVTIWDRDDNVLRSTTIDGINFGSDNCITVTPISGGNLYEVAVHIEKTGTTYASGIFMVSTVEFTAGENLSTTTPLGLDLGIATEFALNNGIPGVTTFLPIPPFSFTGEIIVKGASVYSPMPLVNFPMYIKTNLDQIKFYANLQDETTLLTSAAGFDRDTPIENTCFTAYTDASLVAVAMHAEDNFEIQVIDVASKPIAAVSTMSTEAVGALNSLAANQNYNVARLEFSQNKKWLYVLLRDKDMDVIGNPSKLLKIYINNATIVASDVNLVGEFDKTADFVGQEVPDSFTHDASGDLDYVDDTLKAKSYLSGMFKAADGQIYTLFTNDGTVVPTLGLIINQNATGAFYAKHAPAAIRLSNESMNLGLYSTSLDLSHENVTLDEPGSLAMSGKTFGCTDVNACNYDPEATVHDWSCEFADEGCDCDTPNAYVNCGCYSSNISPAYTTVGGVDYEPCEYCNNPNAVNYSPVPPQDGVENGSMCIYSACMDSSACNYFDSSTVPANWENDSSKCIYAFTGCECDGNEGLTNTTENGHDTHCVECSEYNDPITPTPAVPQPYHEVCGCGEEPIIDGYCDCDTPTPDNCDCDENPNAGFCNGCSGDIDAPLCGCPDAETGVYTLPENQMGADGEQGFCDCDATQKILYYQDSEGDGLGNPNVYAFYCEDTQPEGWVLNNTDTNIICAYDEAFTGYHNYFTGEFISGDVDAEGVCNGPAFIDGCGETSYNTSNIAGTNEDGCCGNQVADCLQLEQGVTECVPWGLATQNAAGIGECNCGYMPSNDPFCSQCVPADQVDVTYECLNCQNIPEGDCDCQGHVEDECGVCNGGNASCTGCMDPIAEDYDPTAIVEGVCTYLTLGEVIEDAVTVSFSTFIIPYTNFETPYAILSTESELDFNTLSSGYTTEDVDGDIYYLDAPNVTSKCQVISQSNPILKCVNPVFNAEILYTITGGVSNENVIETNASLYNTINVPPDTVASLTPTYYFRITQELVNLLETDIIATIFGSVSGYIDTIKNISGATYNPSAGIDNIGMLDGGVDVAHTNSGEGVPTELPGYNVYAITPVYNEEAGSFAEFELNFNSLLYVELPCEGESPTPICCESSGVTNPGNFSTNDEGELIADSLCEVCADVCIPGDVNVVQVCCDDTAENTVIGYNNNEEFYYCNNALCSYEVAPLLGFRMVLTIYTEGLSNLDGLKWALYSSSGGMINQSTPINIGQSVNGVIRKEIQLSSYSDCMWFLPIGFDNDDVWKNVKLEIKNTTITYALGVQEETLHTLTYGASPTPGGSIKIALGTAECLLGCSGTFLQTEYCEKSIREDYTEFTDIILQVNTAGGSEDAFTDTYIEVINISTGDTLSYLETLAPTSEYVKTFRVLTDTKVGIKVNNPNDGSLVYKLLSEFGDLITFKEV